MELKKTEKLEHSVVALTIDVSKDELETAKDKAFKKSGKNITVPGFRRGKAPRRMIERLYGNSVFLEDAVNLLYPDALNQAVKDADIAPVGRANVEISSLDQEDGLTLVIKVPVEPEVTLGTYQGLEVEVEPVQVQDSEVDAELDRLVKRNARTVTVERASQDKDTVNLSYEGFINGVAFEGGKAEKQDLILGSGMMVPGFEEKLLGLSAGEEKEFTLTFPEEYHAKELAGKEATFKVTVHKVSETSLPELDDEFAKDVSDTAETLDDLKAEIRGQIQKAKEEEAEHRMEDALVQQIVAGMTVDLPEAMIESGIDSFVRDFAYRLQVQGITLESYLQQTKLQVPTFRNMFRQAAERDAKTHLALKKIAELENIAVSDTEIEEEYAKMAAQYGLEIEKVKENVDVEAVISDLKLSRALVFVKDHAVKKVKEPSAEAESGPEAATSENSESAEE